MNSIILVVLTILLMILGLPLFAGMGFLALVLFALQDINISSVAIEMYRLTSSPSMITLPLFTVAGGILAHSGSPKRLVDLANSFFGHFPGGIAIIALVVCSFFTAFTGASGVTIIALGGLIYPMLMARGYGEKFSLGLVTTTGSLGLLLPPSLPLILYGIVAQVSIDDLFRAGIVPCLVLVVLLGLWSMLKERSIDKLGLQVGQPQPLARLPLKQALWQARYEIPLPVIIIGGIYGGLFTTVESATMVLIYTMLMTFVLYKDIPISKMGEIIAESMALKGAVLLILLCALGLTNYLVDQEIPTLILNTFSDHISSQWAFLFALNIFLLCVGSMMDIFSAIIVVLPLIIPMANQFEIHPIHLAMIFLTNLEIGFITPPLGINLFISSQRFKKPIMLLYKATIPFVILQFVALQLITYIPALSLFAVKH